VAWAVPTKHDAHAALRLADICPLTRLACTDMLALRRNAGRDLALQEAIELPLPLVLLNNVHLSAGNRASPLVGVHPPRKRRAKQGGLRVLQYTCMREMTKRGSSQTQRGHSVMRYLVVSF